MKYNSEPIACWENKHDQIFITAHGVGRVVGALGSEAGFAGSMLN